jgi:hypothetical protein
MEEQAAMKSRRKVKKIFFSIKGFISYGLLEQFFLGGGKGGRRRSAFSLALSSVRNA